MHGMATATTSLLGLKPLPSSSPSPSSSSPPPLPLQLSSLPNPPLFPPQRFRRLVRLAVDRQDPSLGRAVHSAIARSQYNEDARLLNSLISMYAKLGRLSDARKVFDGLPSPGVVAFSYLISAYAKCGLELQAVGLFLRMRLLGVEPSEYSFVAILTNCIRQSRLELGSQVHALAIKTGHSSCVHVSNAILGTYFSCGDVDAAEQLFAQMTERDVSSWNTIISGMVKDSRYDDAFRHFSLMRRRGNHGDRFSVSSLLTAAQDGLLWTRGEAIHAYALKIGLEVDPSVGNALIAFYTQCGCMNDVMGIFQRMPIKDVLSWTGILNGFMEFGLVDSAVEIFNQMPRRNYITYNALLSGFCQNGEGSQALELFQDMLLNCIEISDVTLTTVLNACAIVSDLKKSEQVHAFLIKVGCKLNAWIEVALIDMYAKCGRMEEALKMLNKSNHGDSFPIAWTSVMSAHVRHGQPDEALFLFLSTLRKEGFVVVDEFTLATILGVCSAIGLIEMGTQLHSFVVKSGFSSDLAVENAIINMYAKCGSLEDAISFFNQMPQHDIVSWNSLLTAYLLYREGDKVLNVWDHMRILDVKPDSITFLLTISACRYTSSNSIDLCRDLFFSMESSYNIKRETIHYAALVDVLGYWGLLAEVEQLIKGMHSKPDALIWRSVLEASKLQLNPTLERQAMQHLLAREPQDPSTYILVSNLYSSSGRWHCSEKVRQEMRQKGLVKLPAKSWIIHQHVVHSFYARDRSHPVSKDIYSGLDILILECMRAGYVPDTSFVLHEVEEYQKRYFLFYHSAKLAVMYGLLMADTARPVRVVKNIRLCGDCHTFLKYASSVTGREISVRDSSGFHSFKAGKCSCGDRW